MTPLVLLFKSLTAQFTSDCLEQILNQFYEAVSESLTTDHNRALLSALVLQALRDLAKLESRPRRLTEVACEWCSAIYANREKFEDWESLLLVCLGLGFRHRDPLQRDFNVTLTHTEHHCGLVDVVFKSQESEAIADLLSALTMFCDSFEYRDGMLGICAGHLVGLRNLIPFSPRLRQGVIRFVEFVGYEGFEATGTENLTELLDHLQVTVEEMSPECRWVSLLLDVIQSSEGTQRLSHRYWEFLVELAISWPRLKLGDTGALKIAKSLIGNQEWDKLECWIGFAWTASVSEIITMTEEDLETSTLLLLRQRPAAFQRLEQWMERWSRKHRWGCVPKWFQPILTRAREAIQRLVAP